MGYKRKVTETDELKKMIKDGKKKFVRLDEGAVLYSVGINTFRQLAVDANALYHIKKITLANTEIIDAYNEAKQFSFIRIPKVMLTEEGFAIRRGKHLAVKGEKQKSFLRIDSLGAGYREDDLEKVFAGEEAFDPQTKEEHT